MSDTLAQQLAGYQVIPVIDISASMGSPDPEFTKFLAGQGHPSFPPPTRWDATVYGIRYLCDTLATIDPDGLDVVLFGEKVYTNHVKTGAEAETLLRGVRLEGQTRTAAALKEAWKLHEGYKASTPNFRGTIFIVITDGQPTGDSEQDVKKALKKFAKKCDHAYEAGFQFLQVGSDKDAKKFLKKLDHMGDKADMFDIIDTKDYYKFLRGELGVYQLCEKALTS